MEIIKSKNIVKKAVSILSKGGTVMHATETCYGFACDALSKKAVLRLYNLKKMNLAKPSSIMVASFSQAKKYGEFNALATRLARKYWPGPLTIIVPRKSSLPRFLNPKTRTIGIRCPAHNLTLKILRLYPCPLITTSANISGQAERYSVRQFKKTHTIRNVTENGQTQLLLPDLIIDSGAIPRRKPSTVIKVDKNKIIILRQGNLKILD
ncbi:threonylcarbamoyl-AMP synthase [Candidatus Peregrinibacteria bacterium]|nr:threonylcarbamoyl-AMP synthase [Candidatus Peregrinibacteria bacterium]